MAEFKVVKAYRSAHYPQATLIMLPELCQLNGERLEAIDVIVRRERALPVRVHFMPRLYWLWIARIQCTPQGNCRITVWVTDLKELGKDQTDSYGGPRDVLWNNI